MKKKIFLILVVIILLICGGISYAISANQQEIVTSPLQPTSLPPSATPTTTSLQKDSLEIKTLGKTFYDTYTTCLSQPPIEAKGKIAIYCQQHTGVTTDVFPQNLKEAGTTRYGVDPVTCSQNPPNSVTIGDVAYEDAERGIVTVIAMYGSSALKIPVQVVKEASGWKIDSVLCPRP